MSNIVEYWRPNVILPTGSSAAFELVADNTSDEGFTSETVNAIGPFGVSALVK